MVVSLRRRSVRLRLTLLYGACFLVSGLAVLALTYGFVDHAISGQTRQLDELYGPRLSVAQMAKLRGATSALSRCARARGISDAAEWLVRGPGGHGVAVGFDAGEAPVGSGAGDQRPGFAFVPSSSSNTAIPAVCWRQIRNVIPDPVLALHGLSLAAERQLISVAAQATAALAVQRRRSLDALLTWSGVALGAMALVSILLGWLMATGALRPLRRVTARARRITEENLHERLSAEAGDDEIGELATTVDGVLARLERAFDAQRRFVANASHELRTPLTLERALLEIALADPETDAETLRRTCERVLASTEQQQQMIEALLALARSQGGTDVRATADLAELAQDAITLRENRLAEVTLVADLHPALLMGDPSLLERLVANLIDNAILHNRAEDPWITVETGHGPAGSWLRVSNSGAPVPARMLPEIFEPFRRVNGERTATAPGLGLGLSIVQAIADAHHAVIQTRPVDGGGLQVEVSF
jgi:signal transduction histidine kinase